MMKKEYAAPILTLITIQTDDVIQASGFLERLTTGDSLVGERGTITIETDQ